MMSTELLSVPKLGFGLMRLPKDGDAFDTAWAYAGSEEAIRHALVERHPRERFLLATKMAAWIDCATRDDALAQFEASLERTGAGYFDFYLLHNLGEARTQPFDDFGLWEWIQEQKTAGTIRHAGFSFHSTADELEELLAAHPEVDFVQLQINYADWENPAVQSRACYEAARAHGVPVVVMEPVKGGMLAHPPEQVERVLRAAEPTSSPASWALRFAADLPGVITVLSGMSTLDQMEDNLATLSGFSGLSDDERATLATARAELAKIPLIPCTTCDYCAKVCPCDIGISGTFTAANIVTLYGDQEFARGQEGWLVTKHGRKHAEECIGCGACERACPQHISIREELKRATALLRR